MWKVKCSDAEIGYKYVLFTKNFHMLFKMSNLCYQKFYYRIRKGDKTAFWLYLLILDMLSDFIFQESLRKYFVW